MEMEKEVVRVKTKIEKRTILASHCTLTVGEFKLGENGEDAKSAPIEMIARSGEPILHPYFGRLLHDMSGMVVKERIVIDYLHDDREICGYLNRFEINDKFDLIVGGAMTPYGGNDRASEVIAKAKAGVPYEASIDFCPRGSMALKLEEVDAGKEVEVNGKTYIGPLIVVREWPLNAVAICPHGADDKTAAYLQTEQNEKVEVLVMKTDAEKKKEADDAAAVEAQKLKDDAEATRLAEEKRLKGVETAGAGTASASTEPDADAKKSRELFSSFVAEFGKDKGADYFALGIDIETARKQHIEFLKSENAKLVAADAKRVKDKLSGTDGVGDDDRPGDGNGGGNPDAKFALTADEETACKAYAKGGGKKLSDVREMWIERKKRGKSAGDALGD